MIVTARVKIYSLTNKIKINSNQVSVPPETNTELSVRYMRITEHTYKQQEGIQLPVRVLQMKYAWECLPGAVSYLSV